ncbi:MAG: hypothetical protein ACI9AT_001810, partial [Ulvibacter sp.]
GSCYDYIFHTLKIHKSRYSLDSKTTGFAIIREVLI